MNSQQMMLVDMRQQFNEFICCGFLQSKDNASVNVLYMSMVCVYGPMPRKFKGESAVAAILL